MESSDGGDSLPPERPSSLQICSYEEYKANDVKARQRASVLWLVSKACDNQLPNDLKDPYYRDHDDQDRLKPMIIQGLSSGALYCSALANIYADPNYHSLNHHGILQVLLRKGVYVAEPADMPLTETVLGQTAPIRMGAHMAVIEGLMALYIKEVLIPDKVVEVVTRFSMVNSPHEIPNDAEEAAVLWINKCCVKLQHRIEEELGSFHSPEESDPRNSQHQRSPSVPVIQDLADLSDGCCLAGILSFYCPDYLPWQEISFNEPVSLADSLYNLQLAQRFCEEHLPHDVCFLTLEDFLYMHDSIKQCTMAFLADLMFLFEIRPARCVVRPGLKEDPDLVKHPVVEVHRRHSHNGRDHRLRSFQQAASPIPDLRSGGTGSYSGSSFSLPDIHRISPRANGGGGGGQPATREKTIERSPSARKIRGHEGSRSPGSPPNLLRRTHSVNLSDAERRRSKCYSDAAGLPSKPNHDEVRHKSDEDEEIAAYFATRDTSLPYDIPLVNNSQKEPLEPLLPAHIKQSKERSNHDTKVQERGEDRGRRLDGGSSESSIPVILDDKQLSPGRKMSDVALRRKEVEEEYAESSPPSKANLMISEGNTRLSAGLEDYYNQLAQGSPTNKQISGGATLIKPALWQKEAFMAKMADLTGEKAALESVDPYGPIGGTTSFAQLSKLRDGNPNPAINIVYMQHEKDGRFPEGCLPGGSNSGGSNEGPGIPNKALKSSFMQKSKEKQQTDDRHTSFAVLPNTTTWQQQSSNKHQDSTRNESGGTSNSETQPLATQLCDVRLQLEERRIRIEQEKRKMETLLKRQRQKLGKAAFLQAVSKTGTQGSPEEETKEQSSRAQKESPREILDPQLNKHLSIKEIEEDLDSVTRKWLKPGSSSSVAAVPETNNSDPLSPNEDSVDEDTMNSEDFQNSIEQLNTSLSDLQADITRISHRQVSIQDLVVNRSEAQKKPNFFLHQSPPQQQTLTDAYQNQRQPPQPPHQAPSSHQAPQLQTQSIPQPQQPQNSPQQQPGFVQSPRRAQWQHQESPPQLVPSTLYGPQQQSPQLINMNVSPRRGQWGQAVPHVSPEQYHMQWQQQQPHPHMRPASVEPQHMMQGHPIHHPTFDRRPPSAIPFMDSRSQGFSLHTGPTHDGYGYPYQMPPQHMYQNGPVEPIPNPNQYDYRTYNSSGSNMQPGRYDPINNYMGYPPAGPQQLPPVAPHHQSQLQQQQPFMMAQDGQLLTQQQQQAHRQSFTMQTHSNMVDNRQQGPQQQQQHSNFQPIAPDRSSNYSEEEHIQQNQPTSLVDDFGRPLRRQSSPENSPPSPPSKPMIGRTFRVPKSKTGGISPTKESAPHLPSEEEQPSGDQTNDISSSKNNPAVKGEPVDKTLFYISFDNDQPKRSKPKKPMRPREVKAASAASRMNGRQNDFQDSSRVSPPPLQQNSSSSSSSFQTEQMENNESLIENKKSVPVVVEEPGVGFFIGADLVNPDPVKDYEAESEMAKKKELIMLLSLRRRAEQESTRLAKEQEYAMQREQERHKREIIERKRDEEKQRRQAILEHYRLRRQQEEIEKNGGGPAEITGPPGRRETGSRAGTLTKGKSRHFRSSGTGALPLIRSTSATRPRPKSVHVTMASREPTPLSSLDVMSRGSHLSLAGLDFQDDKDSLFSVGSGGTYSTQALSPSDNVDRHLMSPTSSSGGGGSGMGGGRLGYLPQGFHHRTGPPSDGASDAGSTTSSAFTTEYTGPKLFVKPTAKSNRGIIINAINTVLAGAVNSDTKRKVLEEINRSESKHFLILFRDSGCQFRAMYSYNPDKDEVIKMYGIGPKIVNAKMMDRFYKYNSGGKSFSEVHTKHLTVTIDAITIQNHLWSGKRALPAKKDLF